jgi:hypothetical protein
MSWLLRYNFLPSVSTSKFIIIENSSVHIFVLEKCPILEVISRFEYFPVSSPTLSGVSNDYNRIVPVRDEEEFLPRSKYIIRNHAHMPGT